ncbi:ATP-grasp domain-containing protein [Flagellimonas marinaquae]
MNILITGVGGTTPRSVARSIKQYSVYKNAGIYGTDINPLAYGLYETELYHKTFVIPPASQSGYWEAIADIVEKYRIDLAIIQPELEVLEWTRLKAEGASWPCNALLPDYELVKLLIDKAATTRALKDFDLAPISLSIDPNGFDENEIEMVLGYPFWIRATTGSSGLGSFKINNRETLKYWITINPGVKQFIGSKYLPGRNLACKMLYHDGKLLRAATGERVNYIMARTAPSGITGNTSYGKLLNEEELVAKVKLAMDILFEKVGCKPHGMFTADLKEDKNGVPYITEINVRMVAFNLLFAAAGANFTEDMITLITKPKTFDRRFKRYEFKPGTLFLRDVDAYPKLMNEKDLKLLVKNVKHWQLLQREEM